MRYASDVPDIMRLLAVEVCPHELRVARAERVFGVTRLTELERIPRAERARLGRPRPGRMLVALPATAVTHRILELPFRDRRRLARTVPLELRGRLPADDDTLVAFDRLATTAGGATVLAAAARRADVDAVAGIAGAPGLPRPSVHLGGLPAWNLVPAEVGDAAMLVADGEESALSVRSGGRLTGFRALGVPTPAAVRWTLAALGATAPLLLVAGGDAAQPRGCAEPGCLIDTLAGALAVRVRPLTDVAPPLLAARDGLACAVAAGLALGGPAPRIVFAEDDDGASLRRIAVLGAAAAALALVDVGLVRHGLARRDAALVAAIRAEAAAVLPGARLVAPRAELEAAAAAADQRTARQGGGVLGLLRALTLRAPAGHFALDEVEVEPATLRLHGRAESFEAAEALRAALAASPLLTDVALAESRPAVDGRGVAFQLRARRRPNGEPS